MCLIASYLKKATCDDETFNSLAYEFASKVPEQVFSPAEVLSFLLERKKSPFDAVSYVES
ncbi:hypothetical protein N7507_011760 [Penicillium longicatenatum]|nr:hypothetical protein N7507_011760 [Penicillium longicatenatum]